MEFGALALGALVQCPVHYSVHWLLRVAGVPEPVRCPPPLGSPHVSGVAELLGPKVVDDGPEVMWSHIPLTCAAPRVL